MPRATRRRYGPVTDTVAERLEAALEAGASIPEADALRRSLLRSWRRHPANGGS